MGRGAIACHHHHVLFRICLSISAFFRNEKGCWRTSAPEWTFEQINFVAGRRGAVVEDDFYNKLGKLNVQAGKRDKLLLLHVQRICEAHDTVMRSYYQQIHGSSGADATTSMENIGEQVYM